ncbi:unnamed protein product, partial [Medioppia subpectinata]
MAESVAPFGRQLQQLAALQDGSHLIQLRQWMTESANVYADVLSLADHLLVSNPKLSGIKSSLPYVVVEQFQQFVKNSPNGSQLAAQLLTKSVRKRALSFALKRNNKTWLDIIADVYHITTLEVTDLLDIIQHLLADNKFFEASLLVIKCELRDHFDIKDLLVPLLLQDKLTVVDDYIRGHEKTHGFEFIKFLDKCFADRSVGDPFADRIPGARRDKLEPKALEKLVTRLLKQHGVDETACPHIVAQRNVRQLRYLLYKRYRESGFSDGSWSEIIINTVADNKPLQEELIYQIVGFRDP